MESAEIKKVGINYINLSEEESPFLSLQMYRVSTTHFDIEDILIRKTTPEKDLAAICKAAKTIEQQIIDLTTRSTTRNERLEAIAAKCR